MQLSIETLGKDHLRKTKSQSHRSKDEEQHEWKLADELASYANKYLQKFVQDKNLKDSILNENPVPTNIKYYQARRLAEYCKELLQENHAKRELTLDCTLEKIQ